MQAKILKQKKKKTWEQTYFVIFLRFIRLVNTDLDSLIIEIDLSKTSKVSYREVDIGRQLVKMHTFSLFGSKVLDNFNIYSASDGYSLIDDVNLPSKYETRSQNLSSF